MLDKYRVSQIIALLNEGHGIKTVARMTGVSRNTVRRFQRNSPHKGHHGRAWRAMEVKLEDIRKLFYDCRGNCSAMLRFVEDAISVEPPSLRTLQKFCTPFRLERLQSRLTKTERFETPPGTRCRLTSEKVMSAWAGKQCASTFLSPGCRILAEFLPGPTFRRTR